MPLKIGGKGKQSAKFTESRIVKMCFLNFRANWGGIEIILSERKFCEDKFECTHNRAKVCLKYEIGGLIVAISAIKKRSERLKSISDRFDHDQRDHIPITTVNDRNLITLIAITNIRDRNLIALIGI